MHHDLVLLILGFLRAAVWLIGALIVWRGARRLTEVTGPLRAVSAGFIVTAALTVLGGFRNAEYHLPDWLLSVLFYGPTLSCLLVVGGLCLALEVRVSLREGRRWVPWRRS